MRKIYVSDLDREVNEGRQICLDVALRRIYRHLSTNVDSTLPEKEFKDWYKSGGDKPFRWNAINYYWDNAPVEE